MNPLSIGDLPTPALVLDRDIAQRNIATMAELLPGSRLRPHVKAHKCTAIARLQYEAGHRGFTCATPREVIGMAEAGLGDDLLLANETVDHTRLRGMAELDAMVTVAVDSEATVVAAAAAGIEHVVVDVNVGLPRCGVAPDESGRLAAFARSKGLNVRGVMGYEGHLMMVPERADRSQQVGDAMALLIRAHQLVGGDIVSAGGTGTFDLHGDNGVNEVQAGSYVLMDSDYGKQGLPFDQALFLIGSVISVSDEWAVLDTGLKSHGMDHGNPTVVDGVCWFMSDEHLTFSTDDAVVVGDRRRVIPAHCDPTMAKHDTLWVVDDDIVVDQWPIDLRGW